MSSELIQSLPTILQQNLPLFEATGAFFAGAYSDTIKNIAGLAGGNQVKVWQLQQYEKLLKQANFENQKNNVTPQPMSPSVGLPILENAVLEEREDIIDLWVKLLAAAMDPKRAQNVRYIYAEMLKKMDPTDALVFRELKTTGNGSNNLCYVLGTKLSLKPTQIEISLANLMDMGCARDPNENQYGRRSYLDAILTAKGVELKEVLRL